MWLMLKSVESLGSGRQPGAFGVALLELVALVDTKLTRSA